MRGSFGGIVCDTLCTCSFHLAAFQNYCLTFTCVAAPRLLAHQARAPAWFVNHPIHQRRVASHSCHVALGLAAQFRATPPPYAPTRRALQPSCRSRRQTAGSTSQQRLRTTPAALMSVSLRHKVNCSRRLASCMALFQRWLTCHAIGSDDAAAANSPYAAALGVQWCTIGS